MNKIYEKVTQLRAEGKSTKEAAKEVGVKVTSYYSYLTRAKKKKDKIANNKSKSSLDLSDQKVKKTCKKRVSRLVTLQLPETTGNDSVFIIAGSSEKIISTLTQIKEMLYAGK